MKGIRCLVLSVCLSLFSGLLLSGQTPYDDSELDFNEATKFAEGILKDLNDVDNQAAILQEKITILKEQGQEATAEAIKLKAQVKTLTDRADLLGKRYVKMIHIAQDYKTQTGTWRTVSLVTIGTTAVLAGVVTFILISGSGGSR